ncbi:MAG: phosphoenolpyruvate synthase, partial [Desulfurococcales archaeon]|nr:phosphoenolpyruvate synthase [Desulfurococcales archaeon]
MKCDKPFVLWLENVDKSKHDLVGGKAAGLGENIKAGIPVPPGFVVTSEAYRCFIQETELTQRISTILKEEIKSGLPEEYERASARIRSLIMRSAIPPSITAAIKQAYRKLGKRIGVENPRVAVRSSATVED